MTFPDTRHLTPDSWMYHALTLARAQLGQTWPNPAVGCVVVQNNKIVGEAATGKGGRPHAETIALAQAAEQARGATLYVTLEPCSHHGKTPPCVDAIIAAGIAKVVVACRDPNPQVNGEGIAKLKAASIEVVENICSKEARELNRGFFSVIEKKRPFIAMKIATSRDGMIAAKAGVRTQITGAESQTHTHQLRAEFDAILTGIGTVLADDPELTVRIKGMEHRSPVRVVLDSHGRLPPQAKIHPAWVYKREENVIGALTERGITRLLIEGGQAINTSFLQNGLVDRLYHYEAPHMIGHGGLSAIKGELKDALKGWQMLQEVVLGADILRIYEKDGSRFISG